MTQTEMMWSAVMGKFCNTNEIWHQCNQQTYHPTNPATSGIKLYAFQLDMNVVTPYPKNRRAMEVLTRTGEE